MLIDCSYFTKGARQIQNATLGTLPNPDAEEVNQAIETYIAENQEIFLKRMLGVAVGNKVHTYLVCLDENEEPKKIENLDSICAKLSEAFADYVFFQILRDINSQATMTGLVRLKCANEYVAPIRRQVNIWNSMVDRNRLFAEWIKTSECKISDIIISDDMITKINTLNL